MRTAKLADSIRPNASRLLQSRIGSGWKFVRNSNTQHGLLQLSTTDGLKNNPDGSLTITIQKDRPTDTSNWFPAPDGPFNLTMRLYGPEPSVLDGSYRLPAVKRIQWRRPLANAWLDRLCRKAN